MKNKIVKILTGVLTLCITVGISNPLYAAEVSDTNTGKAESAAVSVVDENGEKVDTKKSRTERSDLSYNRKEKGSSSEIVINGPSQEGKTKSVTEQSEVSGTVSEKPESSKEQKESIKDSDNKKKKIKSLDEYLTGRCGENITYEFDPKTGILYLKGDGDLYPYTCYAEFPWVLYHDKIQSMEVDGDIDIKLWMCNTKMAAKSNHLGDIDAALARIYADAGC